MSASVETKMKKSVVSFTATFSGVSGYPSALGAYTSSPIVELDDRRWSVRIYPGGYDEDSRGFLSCFVVYESFGQARAHFKFSLLNQKGWKNHSYDSESVKLFVKSNDGNESVIWGDPRFVSRADLRTQSNGFCVEDRLVIKVDMTVFGEIEQHVISSHAPAVGSPSKAKSLSEEMSRLLYEDDIADVTIRTGINGDETIPAHKFILCLRSEVFKAMLTGPMTESTTSEIPIPDFETPVVKEFLHFMYTDTPSSPQALETHAEALLAIACKYQVKGLESLCENYLCNTLSLSNVIEVLSLAELYEAKHLKTRALLFISHNAKAVVQSEGFKSLPMELYPQVMMAVVGVPAGGGPVPHGINTTTSHPPPQYSSSSSMSSPSMHHVAIDSSNSERGSLSMEY